MNSGESPSLIELTNRDRDHTTPDVDLRGESDTDREPLLTHKCGWCATAYKDPVEEICPTCGSKLWDFEVIVDE